MTVMLFIHFDIKEDSKTFDLVEGENIFIKQFYYITNVFYRFTKYRMEKK